jgi:hypothetical protein
VYEDKSIKVNDKHPFVIKAEYEKNGKRHIFTSESFFSDHIDNNGKIKVWTDWNNYDVYYVDVEIN